MADPRAPAVAIEDLGFSYGEAEVLRDFTLAAAPHEVLAVVGPNAAGKTTLLRCLEMVLSQWTGVICIDGDDLRRLRARDVGRKIASVPQSHTPTFPYAVEDVVLMGRNPYLGVVAQPGIHDTGIAREAMCALGIEGLARRPYTQLSGGQLQLVLLARALAQQARVLLLDEPTAHLDFRNRHLVLARIRELADRMDLAVIMTVHDPNDALQYADRAALVTGGTLVAVGVPDAVLTVPNLERLYGIPVEVLTDGRRRVIIARQEP